MLGLRRRPGQPGWGDLLGNIGRSTLELLGAEVAGASTELRELARRAVALAVVGLVALGLAFLALGAAAVAAIAGLAVWLPVWGAALVVFGVLASVALVFALVTQARFRRLEAPGEIVRRRFVDHLEFWRTEILGAADGMSGDETSGDETSDYEPEDAVPRRAPMGGRRGGRPPVSVRPPSADDFSEP